MNTALHMSLALRYRTLVISALSQKHVRVYVYATYAVVRAEKPSLVLYR